MEQFAEGLNDDENNFLPLEFCIALLCCIFYTLTGLGIHFFKEKFGYAPWLHESSLGCFVGIIVGAIVKQYFGDTVTFNSNIFFYLILPPIIFSAGFSLKRKRFFQYLHQIAFFGVFGTVINFWLIALGCYMYGHFKGVKGFDMNWQESFLLSSVLAGSDEVSAMSLVRIKDFPRLGALIFGEGVINDALSIVLFKTFLPMHMHNGNTGSDFKGSVLTSIYSIFFSIIFQIIMSCLIGVCCALMNAYLLKALKFTRHHPIHQSALVMLFGYLSYGIAEAVDVSGILTLFMSAVTLAHYSWHSLSQGAQIATRVSFAAMSDVAEGFAFSYVGLSVWAINHTNLDISFALYMLLIVILSRGCTILGLFAICKLYFKSFKFPISEQIG